MDTLLHTQVQRGTHTITCVPKTKTDTEYQSAIVPFIEHVLPFLPVTQLDPMVFSPANICNHRMTTARSSLFP